MSIGDLRQRIVIEQLTLTPDDSGGATRSWSTFATLFAKIAPRAGTERYFAHKLEENITHIITTRYYPGITSVMRISFEGRIFQIKSAVRQEEKREYMTIMAMEGVAT